MIEAIWYIFQSIFQMDILYFIQTINFSFCMGTFCIFYYHYFFPSRLFSLYERFEQKLKSSFLGINQISTNEGQYKRTLEVDPLSYDWLIDENVENKDDSTNVEETIDDGVTHVVKDEIKVNAGPEINSPLKIEPIDSKSPLQFIQNDLEKKIVSLSRQYGQIKMTGKAKNALRDVKEITNNLKLASENLKQENPKLSSPVINATK